MHVCATHSTNSLFQQFSTYSLVPLCITASIYQKSWQFALVSGPLLCLGIFSLGMKHVSGSKGDDPPNYSCLNRQKCTVTAWLVDCLLKISDKPISPLQRLTHAIFLIIISISLFLMLIVGNIHSDLRFRYSPIIFETKDHKFVIWSTTDINIW